MNVSVGVITELIQEVNQLKQKLNQQETSTPQEVNQLKQELNNTTQEVNQLKQELNNTTQEISELKDELTRLKGMWKKLNVSKYTAFHRFFQRMKGALQLHLPPGPGLSLCYFFMKWSHPLCYINSLGSLQDIHIHKSCFPVDAVKQ